MDMVHKLLQKAYRWRQHTPEALRPAGNSWSPLPPTGNYPEFTSYPAAAVQLYVQKLEDKAKEEKLKQVAIAEAAQHQALAAMRREWQAELSNLQEDVAARRRLLALQVQSKAEDEAIAQLHFAAQQKMSALDHEVAQQATLTKMRDEAQARAAELEARQRAKLKEWETEDEARRLKAQEGAGTYPAAATGLSQLCQPTFSHQRSSGYG
ncbi:WD_REPEATS_REGION domain-containing protein [Haematococcus lacustris]|uniref:WD_REPEATS_REGION domain-containing protein n=1 Tax=Haematococcus lacustris TaxID=44745 RepID=A0A699YUN2_HAELA|nr:WD_REPEATS_REGION domain-containing protein [Haematococcus lacustris]